MTLCSNQNPKSHKTFMKYIQQLIAGDNLLVTFNANIVCHYYFIY